MISTRSKKFLNLAAILLAASLIGVFTARFYRGDDTTLGELTPNDWLLSAQSDEERFRRLQQQLRGFDQPMWEIGERFRRIHESLERQNYDLALYHWEKIATTIRNGIAKRPARAGNAEVFFLGDHYGEVQAGLNGRTPQGAWEAFNRAKLICQSCHQAENVAFINQQPLFDLAPPKTLPSSED